MQSILDGFKAAHAPDGVHFVVACMVFCAVLAIVGASIRLGWLKWIVFIPQQIILAAALVGGMVATVQGRYLDGTMYYSWGEHIPWQHISADQFGWVLIFAMHGWAIIKRIHNPNG